MARGRFLCFCDADDLSDPSRIEEQYDLANSFPEESFVFIVVLMEQMASSRCMA
ncbi:unnamed protein product [Nippostrongylus brasiliensis]|uniref:Glycosyltransferase 2-like domain-containing protein n=1 Tax=Nippostrongylus brasiliensis TaxID=27835 RepID=A0A0N4XS02_NIPBR|nr:unnamed protein product [Nippostrongylus brasiliensis]